MPQSSESNLKRRQLYKIHTHLHIFAITCRRHAVWVSYLGRGVEKRNVGGKTSLEERLGCRPQLVWVGYVWCPRLEREREKEREMCILYKLLRISMHIM